MSDAAWSPGLVFAIGAGGALGALARYAVVRASVALFGPAFPWGTMAVNALGGFILGLIVHALTARADAGQLRAFLVIGALGAFTTFSSFTFDAFGLFRERSLELAALYVAGSVLLAFVGFGVGAALARWWS